MSKFPEVAQLIEQLKNNLVSEFIFVTTVYYKASPSIDMWWSQRFAVKYKKEVTVQVCVYICMSAKYL